MGNILFTGTVLSETGNVLKADVTDCRFNCNNAPFDENDFRVLIRRCNDDGFPTRVEAEHSLATEQGISFHRGLIQVPRFQGYTACFRFQDGMLPEAEAMSNVLRKVEADGFTEYCLQECHTGPEQEGASLNTVEVPTFSLTSSNTPPAPEWFPISNTAGGLCLDVHSADVLNNGGNVQVWECNEEIQQQWKFEGGAVINEGGLCLAAHLPDATTNGGNVQVWGCNGQPQQQWRTEGNAIINELGLCLEVNGPDAMANGGNVQVWDCNSQPQQQWNRT